MTPPCQCHVQRLLGLAIFASSILLATTTTTAKPLPDMNEFLVEGLEEIEPEYAKFEGRMYAGVLPIDNGIRHGDLMFWFFAPDNPVDADSVTVWLNGGPGCSSLSAGLMFENGPVTVPLHPAGHCCSDAHEPLVYNPHAWTQATNMLYVEQPVGVGFSTGGPEPQSEYDVAGDFFVFLQNFFRVFEPYQSSKLFIFGESYAGYYAPSIAYKILQEMDKLDDDSTSDGNDDDAIPLKLAGVGLGNGWADAMVQGPATIDYGYWHGLYDEHTRQALHAEWDHCMHNSGKNNEPEPFHDFNTPDDCAMMVGDLMAAGQGVWPANLNGPNTYDVTTWDGYDAIMPGDTTIQNFFNDPRVKEKLHAPDDVYWRGCIPGAGRRRRLEEGRRMLSMLEHDQPLSTVPYIAKLLDSGIRVLVYNGDRDLSTCAQGSEMLLNGMEWSGADEWFTAQRGLWVNPNKTDSAAGYAKSLKGLDFVVVYNSGHLAPHNQPENSLDLVARFIRNESFSDYPLPDFDFDHKTVNPGTSLANGMYPIAEVTQQQQAQVRSSTGDEHGRLGTLMLSLLMILCFVAGILASPYFVGRRDGYQKI